MTSGEKRVRQRTTYTMSVLGGDLTVADLQGFLAELPGQAKVRIKVSHGDRPGELTETRVEVVTE